MIKPLKYLGYDVVFQEIPDEVTLAINISDCPYHCPDCHSKYLWEYKGNNISDDIDELLDTYKDYITCVCFMGGDQNEEELKELLKKVKSCNLKTALYTGNDDALSLLPLYDDYLDYCKIGHFDINRGGLDKPTTNQVMWKNLDDHHWVTITYKFWKENKI